MSASDSTSSWVEGADASAWPLSTLPYGVGGAYGQEAPEPLVRIGDYALSLSSLARLGLLDGQLAEAQSCFAAPSLNGLMARGPLAWAALRSRLTDLLAAASPERESLEPLLKPLGALEMVLPVEVADYVDFYSSREHATNLGRLFRPGSEPLLPNWRHLPVGYHGRSGTIVVSGTQIRRPLGQRRPPNAAAPTFGPCDRLDFELEVGFVIGAPSSLGEPVPTDRAGQHIFGAVLLNDWSARDVQAWEYQPLGPFLGKSFATSISAWVVPLAALESARVPGPNQDPPVLEYLRVTQPWAFDIELEVGLRTAAMAAAGKEHATVCRTNLRDVYWNPAQHVAHATVNGAALRTGDLHASGTVSGRDPDSFGSLIELAWAGERPLNVGGERRVFLEDGDSVVLRGVARSGRGSRFSIGEVHGTVVPAIAS